MLLNKGAAQNYSSVVGAALGQLLFIVFCSFFPTFYPVSQNGTCECQAGREHHQLFPHLGQELPHHPYKTNCWPTSSSLPSKNLKTKQVKDCSSPPFSASPVNSQDKQLWPLIPERPPPCIQTFLGIKIGRGHPLGCSSTLRCSVLGGAVEDILCGCP